MVVVAEHLLHGRLDGGQLLSRRIAAARDQQHQHRRGVTGVVDGAQRRDMFRRPRPDRPALLGTLAEMVDPANADEPVNPPKQQSADDQDDDWHFAPPRRSLYLSYYNGKITRDRCILVRKATSIPFVLATQIAPELCRFRPPLEPEGARECRAPDAPAASRGKVKTTQASHHGYTGITRHSRTRMVLTASFVLLCLGNLPECANGRFSPTARRWI